MGQWALGAALLSATPAAAFQGEARNAYLMGWGVSLAATVVAWAMLWTVRNRAIQAALGAVVGGMLVRMLLLGVALVWVVRGPDWPAMTFVVGFFLPYLALQAVEIAYLQSRRARS